MLDAASSSHKRGQRILPRASPLPTPRQYLTASMRRTNGFERPFDPYQVTSWVIFVLLVVAHCTLYAPLHHDVASIIVSVLYGICAVSTTFCAVRVMSIDPADPGELRKREAKAKGVKPPEPQGDAVNFCHICDCGVKKRSKHCRR